MNELPHWLVYYMVGLFSASLLFLAGAAWVAISDRRERRYVFWVQVPHPVTGRTMELRPTDPAAVIAVLTEHEIDAVSVTIDLPDAGTVEASFTDYPDLFDYICHRLTDRPRSIRVSPLDPLSVLDGE